MKNEKIIRHMPEFLQEGYNLTTTLDSVSKELDEVIAFLAKTKSNIQISTATGSFLDDRGSLFITREIGETDDVFRARILSFISLARSSGVSEDIKDAISNFTGIDISEIIITDIGPAKIQVDASIGNTFELANSIYDLVDKSKAAGIFAFLNINATTLDSLQLTETVTVNIWIVARFYGEFLYDSVNSKY